MWLVYLAQGLTPWNVMRFVVGSVQEDGVEKRRRGYERRGFLSVCGEVEINMIAHLGFFQDHRAALRAELRETLARVESPALGINVVRGACFARSVLGPELLLALHRLLADQPDLEGPELARDHRLAWLHCTGKCFDCEGDWAPGHVCAGAPAAAAAARVYRHNPAEQPTGPLGIYWRAGKDEYYWHGEPDPRKPGKPLPYLAFRVTEAPPRGWLVYQSSRGAARARCPGGPWASKAEACQAAARLAMEAAVERLCRARREYCWAKRRPRP